MSKIKNLLTPDHEAYAEDLDYNRIYAVEAKSQAEYLASKIQRAKRLLLAEKNKNSKTVLVKASSSAHGYNYTSLSDLAKAGVALPKMRIAVNEFGEFIEYFDGAEWQLGARIVVPAENRRMNDAQAYGAALTYARRYTTLMAMSVASDDDKKLETKAENATASRRLDFDELRASVKACKTDEELMACKKQLWAEFGARLSEKQQVAIGKIFSDRQATIAEAVNMPEAE